MNHGIVPMNIPESFSPFNLGLSKQRRHRFWLPCDVLGSRTCRLVACACILSIFMKSIFMKTCLYVNIKTGCTCNCLPETATTDMLMCRRGGRIEVKLAAPSATTWFSVPKRPSKLIQHPGGPNKWQQNLEAPSCKDVLLCREQEVCFVTTLVYDRQYKISAPSPFPFL